MELVWSRTWALAGLVVPLVVLLLSLRRDRPRPLAIGTFRLWAELPEHRQGGGRRRHVPPHRWLAVLALVCATLALAGPQRREAPRVEQWVVVVDPSPSMFLAHPEGGSRLDVARARLESLAGERDLAWVRPGREQDEREAGRFPQAWSSAPSAPLPEPAWSRHDLPGTVWLTEARPEAGPARAGLVTSGGPAVPGIVGRAGADWLVWDGQAVQAEPGAPMPQVWLDEDLPPEVVAVAESWRDARGLVAATAPERAALRLRTATGEEREFTRAGGDWTARGRARAIVPSGAPLASWVDAAGDGLVEARVGELRVGFTALALAGDPVAWAVDWSELCDLALAPAAEVVSRAERSDAGEGSWRAPGATAPVTRADPWPPTAVLAALAAGLLFLGLVLGQGRL